MNAYYYYNPHQKVIDAFGVQSPMGWQPITGNEHENLMFAIDKFIAIENTKAVEGCKLVVREIGEIE